MKFLRTVHTTGSLWRRTDVCLTVASRHGCLTVIEIQQMSYSGLILLHEYRTAAALCSKVSVALAQDILDPVLQLVDKLL